MTPHLVSISLGPVQDFIAQARRSRDLWFGSHLLSEIARAAAKAIAEAAAAEGEVMLIFPAVDKGDPELEPCDGMSRPGGDQGSPPLAVSNKLLFQASDLETARRCIEAARQGAESRWRAVATAARDRAQELIEWPRVQPVWDEQIEGVLEFYAAAAPVTEDSFSQVRDTLEQQLAARKNLREFQQFQHHRPGAPKSSFEGGRVSVLKRPGESRRVRKRFRIPQSEHLDAVGVVKRTGGQPDQFVPVGNVALAPWLHAARQSPEVAQWLQDLEKEMQSGSYAELFGRVSRRDTPAGAAFGSDAQVLLPERLEALLAEVEGVEFGRTERIRSRNSVSPLRRQIDKILGRVSPAPHPYVAVLVADGDRLGAALRQLGSADGLRTFSNQLSAFATDARRIVEQDAMGSLLYAGGDDVVAFVPLATALRCAAALREAFARLMAPGQALPQDWLDRGGDHVIPTLSVGIGIGHVLTGMGTLLEFGRSAERLAKGADLAGPLQRNALAVLVDRRSGGQVRWRCQWKRTDEPCPVDCLNHAMRRVDRGGESAALPATKLAEILRNLSRFPREVAHADSSAWVAVLRSDLSRTLGRASRGVESGSEPRAGGLRHFGLSLETQDYAAARQEIDQWVSLHLIAREFNRAQIPSAQPTGESGE